MKKTIIASAIAAVVAAPVAFADVKIGGQINQEFFDAGADLQSDMNVDVVISGSEDLGNGMKASFKIHTMYDNGTIGSKDTIASADSSNQANQQISLSGDFGTITTGRFEPMLEGQVVSMAFLNATDTLTIENAQSSAGRAEGGLNYMSPNMNGFQVGVEGFTTESAGSNDFDTTAVMVSYSNGGLTVKVADESIDGGNDTTAIAVQYKMGDLTLRVVDQDSSDNTLDDTYFGAAYTMGANTFSAGVIDSDTDSDGDWIVSAKHALSKSTAVYVGVENDDSAADDTTLVGIQHKF